MPHAPYWFETLGPCFSWIVPLLATAGLWVARSSLDRRLQNVAERIYIAAMLLVAAGTLRTVLTNEGCWLLHMGSMGIMALGATIPKSNPVHSDWGHPELAQSELDGDVVWMDL
jgi:hypothetical protein